MSTIRLPSETALLSGWLLSRAHSLGITRIADITGLDRLGIPCHAAIVASGKDIISSYSGKGVTPEVSRISAVMEATERNASCWDVDRVTVASCDELLSTGVPHVRPEDFTEPLAPQYRSDAETCWIWADDVMGNTKVLVPADIVFSGDRPTTLPKPAFSLVTSNGLAAGFTLEQAKIHGVREVLERDIVSCCELIAMGFDAGYLEALARTFGLSLQELAHEFQCRTSVGVRIRLETLPKVAQDLVDRFKRLGASIAIRALPNHFDLPAFGACAIEEISSANWLAGAGYGVHADPEQALMGAIVEIAQGRATSLHGSREDYHEDHLKSRRRSKPRSDWLLDENSEWGDYEEVASRMASPEASHTLAYYCERAASAGLSRTLSVTFPQLEVPAVRILIPGAETVHSTEGRSRLGHRASMLRAAQADRTYDVRLGA